MSEEARYIKLLVGNTELPQLGKPVLLYCATRQQGSDHWHANVYLWLRDTLEGRCRIVINDPEYQIPVLQNIGDGLVPVDVEKRLRDRATIKLREMQFNLPNPVATDYENNPLSDSETADEQDVRTAIGELLTSGAVTEEILAEIRKDCRQALSNCLR